MPTTTMRYDVADHLRNEEEMRLYIEAAFQEAGDDAAFIARALDDVARVTHRAEKSQPPSANCKCHGKTG